MNQSWFEFWPQENAVPLPLYATIGQHFYVDVTYDGGNTYSFFLFNVGTGYVDDFQASTSQAYYGDSADWVIERPTPSGGIHNGQPTPLSNYGTMTWDQAFYNNGYLAANTNNYQVNMVTNAGYKLAAAYGWGNYGSGSNTGFQDQQNWCGYWGY